MYYVYEWYIVSTGEIIYVGKGVRNRYKVRKHNKFFNEMIKREQCESRIIKKFTSEKEAFAFEFARVREMKAIGQCVCNIYEGGAGGSTAWWTDEIREKYSEQNVMKSERQRKRMSENNPMKNHDVAVKASKTKMRAVVVGNIEYDSVKAACLAFHVSIATIEVWCQRGFNNDNIPCRYKGNVLNERDVHINNGKARPVIYKGIQYKGASDMARAIGISQATASRWCQQQRDSEGNECRYLDDKRQRVNSCKQKSIPVIVNGKWYPNKEKAGKTLGISAYILTQYLNGKKKSTEYICEYGNQQPSQRNTNKSTLEGSETNG